MSAGRQTYPTSVAGKHPFSFGRDYDFHELLADGIVHEIGVVFALVGGTALIFYASVYAGRPEQLAVWIYSIGLIASLAISFTYNMLPHSRLKWYFRRLDHSAIFILIAATYTPFLLRGTDDSWLMGLLVMIWVMAAFGIAIKCLFPGRYDRLAILLYLLMGWSGVVTFKSLSTILPPTTMMLIVLGGLIYSIGVIFHVWEKLRFQNAIWHTFVVVAAVVHYSAVLSAFRQLSP